ncbi:MAG: helix-turn-helix domain-containing protein [Thermoguttaceae bacterium]|jgi:hypothetical protein
MSEAKRAGEAFAKWWRKHKGTTRLGDELEAKIRAKFAEFQRQQALVRIDYETTTGEPYPSSIEEWVEAAYDAGVLSERLLSGDWTPSLVAPIIRGYHRRLKRSMAACPPGERTTVTDPPEVQLTSAEMDILEVLSESQPELLTQESLEGKLYGRGPDAALSDRTIRNCLKNLEESGVVHRPRGPKKGFGLTDIGRKLTRQR